MNRFVQSGEHARMLADIAGRLGAAIFVESTATVTDLPLDWAAAKRRIADERARRG